MRARLLSLVLLLWPLAAPAQDSATSQEDKGFLTTFLEDNLSGAGREVRIDGFAGALSSRATFSQLTIADDQGIWLTIRNGAISWNRTALLSGRVEIAEMSAEDISLLRAPAATGSADTAPSQGFSLPELPVAVQVGQLKADHVELGPDILGEPLSFTAEGSASLEGGEGTAKFEAKRTGDGPSGQFSLSASYSNTSRRATLDLLAAEGAGGIVARLAGLPGQPSIVLALNGSGPTDDFSADIALSTDGAPRLKGTIEFGAEGADLAEGQHVNVDLSGDVTPLFEPKYRPFFGDNAHIGLSGRRFADGRLELSTLDLSSAALQVSGEAALGSDGAPRRIRAEIVLGGADSAPILLPIPGQETTVTGADLKLHFDAAQDDGWSLTGSLDGLKRADLEVSKVTLKGSGTIQPDRADGDVALSVGGLTVGGPDLAGAVGDRLDGRVAFAWQKGAPVQLPVLTLAGADYNLSGKATVDGGKVDADVTLVAQDLSRFAALVGADLKGGANVRLSGSYDSDSGTFGAKIDGAGTALGIGMADLERLLSGTTNLTADLSGTATDIALNAGRIETAGLTIDARGRIAAGATDLAADLSLDDLGRLRSGFGGAVSGQVHLTEAGTSHHIEAALHTADPKIGNATLNQLLAGMGDADLALTEDGGRVRIDRLVLSAPRLSAKLLPDATDPDLLTADARLSDTAILVPEFPGETRLSGTIRQGDEAHRIDLAVNGPGGVDAKLEGDLAADLSRADLAATGQLRAEAANAFIAPRVASGVVRFDLKLDGPPALSSLSGTVTTDGARVADPTVFVAVENLSARATLSGGRVAVSAKGGFRDGGTIGAEGSLSLAPGLDSDVTLTLDRAVFRDPQLFQTEASGAIRLSGPVARGGSVSGAITLGQTEIRVGTASFGATRTIPPIDHVGEPARVRASRARAGLLGQEAAARGPSHPMSIDLRINAPQRIFVRGRGLDAELGGALSLTGTTANIIPAGQFQLIRGRLDILTKRLTITEGLVEMRGALEPYLRFVATHEGDGVLTTVTIEGLASAPTITFSSSPELPQEEVVSQLLFGRGVQTLSAFQAAQLASAVATLAGKGGEGIVSRLRKSLGVDDLDVSTDAGGGTTLRAGKYISEKLYTDLSVGSDGKTEINLNLDIRKGLKARGTVGSEGSTGLGIFFEKDY